MLTSNRLTFFDNLRVVLMAMVIIHHVGQAYGPTGGWWPVQELTRAEILGPFFMVNRSFGMSLFFMIAGYFTARSCNKNGPTGFMRSRLVRLGIPLLGFSLLMILLQVFLFGPLETGQLGPIWPIDVLHFWFVQHLLLYSLGYALWRMLRARSDQPLVSSSKPPGYTTILAFALALALATAIVRTWYDTDEWIYLFGYLRIAPADVPRDLGLFLVGTLAYRKDWVSRFPSRAGHTWLILGLFLAGLWSVYELWLGELLVFSDTVWGLLFPMWESLLCCSMCIGLIVLFRDNMNAQGPIAKELAQSTYAAYMLHVFVVILFQYLALGLAISPLLKFFLVSLITVPVTFLMASMIRRSGRWLFRGQTQHATAGQAVGR
jgi:glucan biosynthesis protein C